MSDYKVGQHITVKLSGGRLVTAVLKANVETTEGERLQVSFGNETAGFIYGRLLKNCDSVTRTPMPRLKTRNWQKALAEARQKELEGFKQKTKSPTIEQACDKYSGDAKQPSTSFGCCSGSCRTSRKIKDSSSFQILTWIIYGSSGQHGRTRTNPPE